MSRLSKCIGCLLVIISFACSCIWQREPVRQIVRMEAEREPTAADVAAAEEWILAKVSESLRAAVERPVVRIAADEGVRVYRESWGEEIPHVDIFYGDYSVRLPLEEIAAYPLEAVEEQLETEEFGPVELKNGWLVWLGYFERADAIWQDLSLSVRDTCNQLSASADPGQGVAVRELCERFQKVFVFADDFGLYRRVWRSSFEAEAPKTIGAEEALATFFLADLKRLISLPGAYEHVAEVSTARMRGFEFGDETSPEGFSAELFDDQGHLTVLFLPPEVPGEPLDEQVRGKILASVRRHGRWVPGLEMISRAEEIQEMAQVGSRSEIAGLLLFSSLQFPDHRTRAARMLLKFFSEEAPEEKGIIEALRSIASGEGRE